MKPAGMGTMTARILVRVQREIFDGAAEAGGLTEGRRDIGGRIDLFFRFSDALTHPGEITNLHTSSRVR